MNERGKPEDDGPKRASGRALLGLASLVAVLSVGVAFVARDGFERARAGWLAQENRLLESELRRVQSRLADFETRIDSLAEKDERTRLLAGRVGIDAEVFAVGVGGPGLASPEDGPLWPLDSMASELAYAARYDLAVLERKVGLLDESLDETTRKLEENHARMRAMPSVLPTRGVLTSRFSWRRLHPVHGIVLPHLGVDVYNVAGTPIAATGDGTVVFAGWKRGYGNTVEIDHGFGVTTVYSHASKLLAYRGQRVRRHDVVAQVGCTGVCTAPHVHYEVRVNGRPRNPMNYVLDFDAR